MADSQIYARQLLVKRHGYPLWIPEPYGHSPIYRTKGVRIGDVGYVTQDGAFRTLFNIRASPNDPINRRGVPNGFQQVHLDAEDIDRVPNFQPPNSSVASTYAKQRSLGAGLSATQAQTIVGAGAALQYVWSSTEGAILHLPKGASRVDVTKKIFREQAMRHAKNWYEFACDRSDVSNGSLYLITGCDKTNSWMVGAFYDCASGSQAVLQLSAIAGMLEGNLSYSYSWATSSPASHRVGPSIDETVASDEDPDALERDDQVFATDAPPGSNQCTFIRGYKITLRRDVLRRILGGSTTTIQVSSIEDVAEEDIQRNSSSNAVPASVWYGKGKAKASGDSRDSGGEWDREPEDDSPPDEGDIRLEEIPGPCEDCHPSTLINNFMLEKYADAEVAITHDDDWIDLIDDEDQLWPTDDELLSRLQLRRTFYHSQNAVLPVADPIRPDSSSKRQFIVPPKPWDVLQIDGTLTRGTDDGERPRKRARRTTPKRVPQHLPSSSASLVGSSTYDGTFLANQLPSSDSLAEEVSFPIIESGREPHVARVPIANQRPTTGPKGGPLPCSFCRRRRIKCKFRGDAGSCEHCLRRDLDCVPWTPPEVTLLTPHSMTSPSKGPLRNRQQRARDQSSPQPERQPQPARARSRSVSQEL